MTIIWSRLLGMLWRYHYTNSILNQTYQKCSDWMVPQVVEESFLMSSGRIPRSGGLPSEGRQASTSLCTRPIWRHRLDRWRKGVGSYQVLVHRVHNITGEKLLLQRLLLLEPQFLLSKLDNLLKILPVLKKVPRNFLETNIDLQLLHSFTETVMYLTTGP